MDTPLIISVSGLRGIVGTSLTPEIAARYACAFSAATSEEGPFVITSDGRASGEMLAKAIVAALHLQGRSTIQGGIAATPTTGVLIGQYRAAGGIQISASHNPAPYNGLKLFSHQGRVVPKEFGEGVLVLFNDVTWSPKPFSCSQRGESLVIDDTITSHLKKLLALVDVAAIKKQRFRVLLDSNHGAGSILGQRLLDELGCLSTYCGKTPDGLFEHTPEPTKENLTSICERVRKTKVDVGFCQDPDADRLAVIDAQGNYLGEEYTLALCAWNRLEQLALWKDQLTMDGPLVINCATSRMTIDLAHRYGRKCFCSPVGEANVVDLMLDKEAVFGGEGNGGPIDPLVGLVRDSFVGMMHILDLMARQQKTLAELVRDIPAYSIVKRKRACAIERVPKLLSELEKAFPHDQINREDGVRFDRPNGWVLIRGSNTEPIIRIIAEAEHLETAEQFCDEIEAKLVIF